MAHCFAFANSRQPPKHVSPSSRARSSNHETTRRSTGIGERGEDGGARERERDGARPIGIKARFFLALSLDSIPTTAGQNLRSLTKNSHSLLPFPLSVNFCASGSGVGGAGDPAPRHRTRSRDPSGEAHRSLRTRRRCFGRRPRGGGGNAPTAFYVSPILRGYFPVK